MRDRSFYRWWMWSAAGAWLLPAFALLLCALAILLEDLEGTARLPLVAVGLSLLFFDQRHRLEATRLLREVSERCNERYESQWPALHAALERDGDHRLAAFTRYLNLCAEEHLYHSLGLLHPRVWDSWRNGMRAIFREHEALREFARAELKSRSYYGFGLPEI
jgi:hypothetical protein